jgi:hypothetical protein
MNIIKKVAAGIAIAGGVALVAMHPAPGLVHPDYFPALSTYGVSIGTDIDYCSLELVHGSPSASCEHVPSR